MDLDCYLADLERIREDLRSLPTVERAIVLTDRESSASRLLEIVFSSSWAHPLGRHEMWYVHVYRSHTPSQGERSAWSFPVDRIAPADVAIQRVARIYGRLEPGAGVGVEIDGEVVEPIGPLRPLVRGVRWVGPADRP